MKKSLIIVALLLVGWNSLSARGREPDAYQALKIFERFQLMHYPGITAERTLNTLSNNIGFGWGAMSFDATIGRGRVLLVVPYRRTDQYLDNLTYGWYYDRVCRFLASGDFYRGVYQWNGLNPNQARQTVWQMSNGKSAIRIIATPDNEIVIAFFSVENWSGAMASIRSALVPTWGRATVIEKKAGR